MFLCFVSDAGGETVYYFVLQKCSFQHKNKDNNKNNKNHYTTTTTTTAFNLFLILLKIH